MTDDSEKYGYSTICLNNAFDSFDRVLHIIVTEYNKPHFSKPAYKIFVEQKLFINL